MLQRSFFTAALGSLAQYSVPLIGLTLNEAGTTFLRLHSHTEAHTEQGSTSHTGASSQQLVAPRSSTGSLGWLRRTVCLPPAVLASAAAAYSSRSQATPAFNIASTATKVTPLQQCLRLMYDCAARQAAMEGNQAVSADNAADVKRWAQYLGKHLKTQNDYWQYVHCGSWAKHPNGWTGQARALLQVWHVPGLPGKVYDHMLWELDSSGLPTGKAYFSGSGFEKVTDRGTYRRYTDSIKVLTDLDMDPGHSPAMKGRRARGHQQETQYTLDLYGKQLSYQRLETWLRNNFGVHKLLSRTYRGSETVFDPEQQEAPSLYQSSSSAGKQRKKKKAASRNKPGDQVVTNFTSESALAAIAAAAGASGPTPAYKYPGPPMLQSPELKMSENDIYRHLNLVRDIAAGTVDLAETHIPVTHLLPGFTTVSAATTAGDQHDDGNQHQVYRIEELQQRAEAVVVAQQQGLAVDSSIRPVVPDSFRPFTITMTNGKDGREYVVAHYEPEALKEEQSLLSSQLCTIFHGRNKQQMMVRASAPRAEAMVMAGVRMPVRGGGTSARFGRYHGDTGPGSDAFAATAWPFLRTRGKFPLISKYWTNKLSEVILSENSRAAQSLAGSEDAAQPGAANFPSPCLFGSPFTCLGITQNYLSKLHCEPGEHPFSFITWQDLLCPGSTLEVGYFWLTAGLAFLPQPGSALYIDVRLVTHRSERCVVHDSQYMEEGRYGCALFIKPPVLRQNAELWAQFDAMLKERQSGQAQHQGSGRHQQNNASQNAARSDEEAEVDTAE